MESNFRNITWYNAWKTIFPEYMAGLLWMMAEDAIGIVANEGNCCELKKKEELKMGSDLGLGFGRLFNTDEQLQEI